MPSQYPFDQQKSANDQICLEQVGVVPVLKVLVAKQSHKTNH